MPAAPNGYNRGSTLACRAAQPDKEQLMNPNGTWITDGTIVQFMPNFGIAIVLTPIPTTISGSAVNTAISGRPVCLEGDERSVASSGCVYIAPPYTTPGVGTLKIMKLAPDQLSSPPAVGKKTIFGHYVSGRARGPDPGDPRRGGTTYCESLVAQGVISNQFQGGSGCRCRRIPTRQRAVGIDCALWVPRPTPSPVHPAAAVTIEQPRLRGVLAMRSARSPRQDCSGVWWTPA